MALIGLYCFASLMLFIKIEPFSVLGVFLIICYLPGLCIFALSKSNKILFEDLILAFPVSIGFSSILILALLSLGIQVNHVPVIIHVIIGLAVIIFVFFRKNNKVYGAIFIKKEELLFSSYALLIILLLSVPFFIGPNRISISAHAFHHSLIISQIMNGIFPPENPGLGGTIIGYYWGFHALIAALTVKTNYHQIQIIFILNVISLYAIFCISYVFAKVFDLSESYRYIMPLAIIGLMRADAGILVLSKLFSGNLMSLKKLTASPIDSYFVLSQWVSGLSWIDSRQFFLHKLYNASGMLLALSLCYAYLLIVIKEKCNNKKIYMTGIALIISACFINYPPLAIFLLFHVPLWFCYIFLSSSGNFKEKISQASRIAVPYFFAGLVVAPYMLYIMGSRNISSGGQGEIFSFDFYNQSLKNMIVFMVSLPIIVYGIWVAFKRYSLSNEFYFLGLGTVLCLALTVFTRWPFDNSYKFNYILLFFFTLYFIFAVNSLLTLVASKWSKRLIATGIIVFFSLTPIVVESSYIISSFSTDYVYLLTGSHIEYAQDKQKNEAYTWIRENTPYDALIMLSYFETNWPCCGLGNNYEAAAIAERTLYVIRDDDYTVSNPEYAKRVLFRKKLFENPYDRSVIDFFSAFKQPIYLLIEDNLDERRFFVEDRFKPFPYRPGRGFVLVYQNERQMVYRIHFNK